MGLCVLQPWVQELSIMQQSVLLTAVRGPDTIQKDHVSKVLLRWYRRCILITAFEKQIIEDPYEVGGGSFTGPCRDPLSIEDAVEGYLRSVDEMPHHFQLHFMHAAEIIGYKHPKERIREFWWRFYYRLVKDAHLNVETADQMDKRLGDNEAGWRAAEEVFAK